MIINLKKDIKSRILNGHPWIYSNEILNDVDVVDGDIVDVFYNKNFVGKGYYNSNSLIRIRLLTKKNETIDFDFFKNKILRAKNYRENLLNFSDSYRLIFGEADGLPGLIVDKFNDYLVIQVNTLGIFKYKFDILKALIEIFNPKGIYEKDDEKSSKIEGFDYYDRWVHGNGPDLLEFELNNIKFFSDLKGQKTGFFLDQRLNALNFMTFCKDKNVLDAFSYTGNFGIHALCGGANHVTFVDFSERALEVLELILKNNNISSNRYDLIHSNAFDYLRMMDESGKMFDITSIDPPSLAKSRKSKPNAFRGYKEINLRALKITKNGGLLNTSSCTQIIYPEEFFKTIFEAAENTNKSLKLINKGVQSPDHPVCTNIFETEYLKNYLFYVEDINNY
ncbi:MULTISPECIES: class I SAM-dependent rRNA methyltransferase [Oceanotoga]|jgi:23S rRNA (cytosine1962-C5)-methyltransferase|uniref:SAM-dependent methyltransferase n=1 Tax=Oceanotoga teriensis TaxID=515440 RepID=A0AA45C9C6_9BACT|nr:MULTISPECIES: class I SAM-dependent rRNA methyltransferase [Oceanotoga]MDN5342930.1 rRNA (cytosine1962-C5)-methyltransferase [Oceanotoga sp.]MDO7975352.1 class I SAM-dependent rRNA methyltransferase [Oceanotoga teriensis]PWJ96684.1 SAM-dependent methyltransferase [Oceanotoga teriensis]